MTPAMLDLLYAADLVRRYGKDIAGGICLAVIACILLLVT